MPEKISSLYSVYRTGFVGNDESMPSITVQELLTSEIIQISGWPTNFDDICENLSSLLSVPIPKNLSDVSANDSMTVFRVGPERLWVSTMSSRELYSELNNNYTSRDAVITDISHAKTSLRITGPNTCDLLSRGLAIDLSNESFPEDAFVQSNIIDIPVLVHRRKDDEYPVFNIYVPRELSVSLWEWITESAIQLGCEIIDPV